MYLWGAASQNTKKYGGFACFIQWQNHEFEVSFIYFAIWLSFTLDKISGNISRKWILLCKRNVSSLLSVLLHFLFLQTLTVVREDSRSQITLFKKKK